MEKEEFIMTYTEVKLKDGKSAWINMSAEELNGLISLKKDGILFDDVLIASENYRDVEVRIDEIDMVAG